jgi:quercetin dioxygenase-like cupin family protein
MGYRSDQPRLTVRSSAAARELAADPHLPTPLNRGDMGADHRPFVPIVDEPELNGWVIAWPAGSDTGYHDHDGSRAIIIGLHGHVTEQRPVFGRTEPRSRTCTPGDAIELAPEAVHRMHNLHGDETALTLHLYSPPLVRQAIYRLLDGQPILRYPIDGDQELRPCQRTGSASNNRPHAGVSVLGP